LKPTYFPSPHTLHVTLDSSCIFSSCGSCTSALASPPFTFPTHSIVASCYSHPPHSLSHFTPPHTQTPCHTLLPPPTLFLSHIRSLVWVCGWTRPVSTFSTRTPTTTSCLTRMSGCCWTSSTGTSACSSGEGGGGGEGMGAPGQLRMCVWWWGSLQQLRGRRRGGDEGSFISSRSGSASHQVTREWSSGGKGGSYERLVGRFVSTRGGPH